MKLKNQKCAYQIESVQNKFLGIIAYRLGRTNKTYDYNTVRVHTGI